jgi:cytoskeletal protein CcmA (bactofilin family)
MADDKDKKVGNDSLEGSSSVIEPDKTEPPAPNPPVEDGSLSEPESLAPEQNNFHSSKIAARVMSFANLYFVIFLLLIFLALGGIFAALKLNKDPANQSTKTQSLTDKQLADVKSSTTLVGDAQQTLDIQGNSIFEGQVLLRNNLDIAGSIKVGGNLSLPSITVGGTSTFGQLHINDQLAVVGNTILQGTLTAQKGVTASGTSSFGTLSASQINTSSLQINGDFIVSRHINVSGGTPGRSNGSALGGGGTASVSGTDAPSASTTYLFDYIAID